MIRFKGENITLMVKLDDGVEDQYPQAVVYSGNVEEDTVNLTHSNDGIYKGTWDGSSSTGEFVVNYIVYSDVDHTTPNTDYTESSEIIFITDDLNALEDKIDTIDSNVDDILVDTGTTLDGKINTIDTLVDAVKEKTDTIDWDDITFIKDINGGGWLRDGTKLYLYKADNETLVAEFDLLDANGDSANESSHVFQRDRVADD